MEVRTVATATPATTTTQASKPVKTDSATLSQDQANVKTPASKLKTILASAAAGLGAATVTSATSAAIGAARITGDKSGALGYWVYAAGAVGVAALAAGPAVLAARQSDTLAGSMALGAATSAAALATAVTTFNMTAMGMRSPKELIGMAAAGAVVGAIAGATTGAVEHKLSNR